MHVPLFVWLVVALVALRLAQRPLVALFMGRQIGAGALAKQAPVVHLEPAGASAARQPAGIEDTAQALTREGFYDAGWFTVAEMPEMALRLLVHEPEGWLAMIYEHRRVGQWLEIGMRFPDGSRMNFTNKAGTGLAPLPGVDVRHMVGVSVEIMLRTARAAKAKRDLTPLVVSVTQAPRIFEEGYARLLELRRQQGISRAEVVAVAVRPQVAGSKRAS